jgi:secreted PhoX family phosphatase
LHTNATSGAPQPVRHQTDTNGGDTAKRAKNQNEAMINRRNFIQSIVMLAAVPRGHAVAARSAGFGKLLPDSGRVLDLPEGFEYRVIAQFGDEMADGLLVPGRADGMAAFPGRDSYINLVCNHELTPAQQHESAFGAGLERYAMIDPERIYDDGDGITPGAGATTTIVYDPRERRKERQFLSLAGTELNCAGGKTPWGSWLSCEESFGDIGPAWKLGTRVQRRRRHGYVFEVPADAEGPVMPRPLQGLCRFEHEAAAVEPASGVIYLTEDRHRSLLYRFVPDVPRELHRGGRLQALAVSGKPSFDTRNWTQPPVMRGKVWLPAQWIDLEDVDGDANDLRLRGFTGGAARFARGEGLCIADGSVFITCTIGGPHRLGQVFEYRASPFEGTVREREAPGRLRLLAEADDESLLRHADNITVTPWGDLLVCEDTADHCGLVCVRPDGTQYAMADNAYTESELAGACFSPDGGTLFVNIQDRGLTLAINGPW